MKKQSGFTLIELLLVLAIIGIISAIAIPALLSQRARARDKSATENMVGRVGDLIGQWDKFREKGYTSGQALTSMQTYLVNTSGKDKNPWNTSGASGAYDPVIGVLAGNATASAFAAAAAGTTGAGKLGQVKMNLQYPNAATGNPGFIGGAVYLQASSSSDTVAHIKTKVSSIE